jgi:subtilase family serine protease
MAFNGAQIQHAYGMDAVTLYDANGNPVQGDGSGETIALVDAYREPNIANDLAQFDADYGLPDPPSFTEIYAQGTPASNTSWGLEIALDVEYAHAMAPGANILLVDAQTNSTADLFGAVDVARNYPGVATVSMSWGVTEYSGDNALDGYFLTPAGHNGVSFFAASGDTGGQRLYPAMSPYVVSVGGTSLTAPFGNYRSESAWDGSGGGQSSYSPEPRYQDPIQSSGRRQGPDVSADANPSTGVEVYDTYGYNGTEVVGGTSAASPMWAGVIAVADEGLNLLGYDTLNSARVHAGLYGLAYQQNYPYYDGIDFHDIQSGSSGGNQAGLGYDEATGIGSPIGYNLIPDLISYLSNFNPPPPPSVDIKATTGKGSGTAASQLIVVGSDSDAATPPAVMVALPAATGEALVLPPALETAVPSRTGGLAQEDALLDVRTASLVSSAPMLTHHDASIQVEAPDLSFESLDGTDTPS